MALVTNCLNMFWTKTSAALCWAQARNASWVRWRTPSAEKRLATTAVCIKAGDGVLLGVQRRVA